MTYSVAFLADPYSGRIRIIDAANDYIEAWRRAAAARRLRQGGIFFVLSAETREDPQSRGRKLRSDATVRRDKRA